MKQRVQWDVIIENFRCGYRTDDEAELGILLPPRCLHPHADPTNDGLFPLCTRKNCPSKVSEIVSNKVGYVTWRNQAY